jgi:hypothetical protein
MQVMREKICPYTGGMEVSWTKERTMWPRCTLGLASARCLRTCEGGGGGLGGCLDDCLPGHCARSSEARCDSFDTVRLGHVIAAT